MRIKFSRWLHSLHRTVNDITMEYLKDCSSDCQPQYHSTFSIVIPQNHDCMRERYLTATPQDLYKLLTII